MTEVINLQEVQAEWPYVLWVDVLGRNRAFENLREGIEDLIDCGIQYISVPFEDHLDWYLGLGEAQGFQRGQGDTGWQLNNPEVEISFVLRRVQWEIVRSRKNRTRIGLTLRKVHARIITEVNQAPPEHMAREGLRIQ